MNPTISHLYIYPIKSCAGVEITTMQFDALGALYDRRYMLVDEQGKFVTQRHFPTLCLVQCLDKENAWQVLLPNGACKKLEKIGKKTHKHRVNIWSDSVEVYEQGDEWAQFFSEYLAHSVRLVYIDETCLRYVDRHYAQQQEMVGFADGFPLLLANQSSLDTVNEGLEQPLSIIRFRPNIVVKDIPAWLEDTQPQLFTKDLQLTLCKPCSRCVIPSINPNTAEKQSTVVKWLVQKLKAADGQLYFGQNVLLKGNGVLSVGDILDSKPTKIPHC